MNQVDRYRIAHEFRSCITRTIERVSGQDTHRPFHAALLSDEALFWSRFERSFSTSFGQRVIEKISKIAVDAAGATESLNQKPTQLTLPQSKLSGIEDHITAMRSGSLGRHPNWELDVRALADIEDSPEAATLRVISDLWWVKDGINHYLSIKTVKPNIDQTAEAKRDLLKLQLADPHCKVYFGLYYNPYGDRREDYAWSPPQGIFNFRSDPSVLIGEAYWNVLGGDGFYSKILEIAVEVGGECSQALRDM